MALSRRFSNHTTSNLFINKRNIFNIIISFLVLCIFYTSAEKLQNAMFFKYFETSSDIPKEYFKSKKEINGFVHKVIDGDTIRIRHSTFWSRNPKFIGPLKDHTISVRLAGVDAPEISKFGQEGQLFSQEAKEFVTSKVSGKYIKVKLLSKDQYGRVVGRVKYKENFFFLSWEKDLSEELLKKGLAVVYTQGGAQYDGNKLKWLEFEKKAQAKRMGMWKHGAQKVVLPSEYKQKHKNKPNRI